LEGLGKYRMGDNDINNDVRLEILISTMHKTSLSFIEQMFPYQDLEKLYILVVNQTEKGKELVSGFKNVRVINSYEKGLSLSRNIALKNAIGDICLIADDDIEYLPNFDKIILNSFHESPMASIIRFKINTYSGRPYKVYPSASKRLISKKDILNTSSVEIALKREHIVKNKISFNTLFGLGSYFTSGEEYLFLKEVLKVNLKVYFENTPIVLHKFERSTSNTASDDFVKAQAAIYAHDYNKLSYLFLFKFIFFLLRKRLILIKDFKKKYQTGLSAIDEYQKLEHARL